MDWFTAVLAPLILAVLTFCGNSLCVKINYIRELQDNLGLLKNALNDLLALRKDVLDRVRHGERNGGTRRAIVIEWLLQVDTMETNTNQLIAEACGQDTSSQDALPVHQRESTSCCWFTDNISNCCRGETSCCWSTDNISNCCLGEMVFRKIDEVRNLYTRGEFDVVTQQHSVDSAEISIPVVETTGKGNSQCSMIYARRIDITHSEKPENWTWSSIYEPPNEVAILNEVYWLDIRGIFHTRTLTQERRYEVVFVVKLKENAYGWENPVNLSLQLVMRDKRENPQERTLCLDDCYINDKWVDIKVGEFVAPPKEASGKILFTMFQYDTAVRKTGLVVKGVAIRAVN